MHVLSLPPAFVLSQDQTLRLNEIQSGIWSRIDEVTPSVPSPRNQAKTQSPTPRTNICEFSRKYVNRRVSLNSAARQSPTPKGEPGSTQRPQRHPPSTIPFLQNQIVKEPTEDPSWPSERRPPETDPATGPRSWIVEKSQQANRSAPPEGRI